MNVLRATVRVKSGWWEAKLLDLDIVADGASESAMLREIEYTLTAEYHLALEHGQTPFVKLVAPPSKEVQNRWEDGEKEHRALNLSDDVKRTLAVALRSPSIAQFRLEPVAA